jgi:hypothetical protein
MAGIEIHGRYNRRAFVRLLGFATGASLLAAC